MKFDREKFREKSNELFDNFVIWVKIASPRVLYMLKKILRKTFRYTKRILKYIKKVSIFIIHLIWRRKTLKISLYLFTAGVLFIIGLFAYFWQDLPSIDTIRDFRIESTKIYDRTGEVSLYNVFGTQNREIVALEDIPQHVQDATIVSEDDNFYGHFGVDFAGITRAAWVNIIERGVSQGGSTITQQFIKNILLTPEQGSADRTIGRKIKEVILSIELEIKYSKEEILELYLNQIAYGSNAYGIATASRSFLDKPVQELTLGEAALLASLINRPSYYIKNPDKLEERRVNYVLKRMNDLGYITDKEFEDAKNEEVALLQRSDKIIAPHFVFEVIEQLEERYGRARIEKGGLKVITTLDIKAQEIAEQAINQWAPQNQSGYNAGNAALVAIEPSTGHIIALVGSKDYYDQSIDGNVNVATRARQPGSSFKPFAYAQAVSEGYTIDTVVYDTPTEFNPLCDWEGNDTKDINGLDCYSPENYDNRYYGQQTFKEALAQSRNVPAVKALYLAGVKDTVALAQSMGISTLENINDNQLSLVLGGSEVTLLEETAAYGVFSTRGTYTEPIFFTEVRDNRGNVLDKFTPESKKVIEDNVADQITHALSSNTYRAPVFGPSSYLVTGNIKSAAKTGTTQEFRDAWTVGYTPSISVGVWVGNNNNTRMWQNSTGSRVAAPIWNNFITNIYQSKQASPENELEFKLPNPDNESFAGVTIPRTSKDILNGVADPTYPHSILHFINKDDPKGATPNDPERADPLYENFERPVRMWAGVKYDEDIPIDSDSSVVIESPTDGDIVYGDGVPVSVSISIQDQDNIDLVSLYIDSNLLRSYEFDGETSAQNIHYYIEDLDYGEHTITVNVYTVSGKTHISSIKFSYIDEEDADEYDGNIVNSYEYEQDSDGIFKNYTKNRDDAFITVNN